MLAFIFQSFRDSSLTVPQPFTILPALLLHHTTSNTLPKGNIVSLVETEGEKYPQWQISYLSEPLKAANRLTGSSSISKTFPQPLFIPHPDIVTGIHVTSICKTQKWVKENLIVLGLFGWLHSSVKANGTNLRYLYHSRRSCQHPSRPLFVHQNLKQKDKILLMWESKYTIIKGTWGRIKK